MKKVEAIVRDEKLDSVVEKLTKAGYGGMTITDVEGHGRQKGIVEEFRGKEYKLIFIPKVKVEVVVQDENVESVIDAIIDAAFTNEAGDGKIFIIPVDDAIRVRTKERGNIAV